MLVWLQADPEATGEALMAKLQAEHSNRFSEAQLRTMQRMVKKYVASWPKSWFTRGAINRQGFPLDCRTSADRGGSQVLNGFGNIFC